jgi:hypothetical protein
MRKQTEADIEAAVEAAYSRLKFFKNHGWLREKGVIEPERLVRFEAFFAISKLPDEVMPAFLRNRICRVLLEPPKGKRTYAGGRDRYIDEVLFFIGMRGFGPTRNPAMREKEKRGEPASQSQCSIVAKALKRLGIPIDEQNLERIRSTHPRLVYPPELAREQERAQKRPIKTAK